MHGSDHTLYESLHKYKEFVGVDGKNQSSSFQEGTSHTYTLRVRLDTTYFC